MREMSSGRWRSLARRATMARAPLPAVPSPVTAGAPPWAPGRARHRRTRAPGARNEGIAPLAYAEQLLALYRSLWVTTAFGDWAEFRSAPELMEFWQRRNAHVSRQGLLPPGILTFDIVATNEPLEAPASRHRPG